MAEAQLINIESGETFTLDNDDTTLGRADGCTLVVRGDSVSSCHATIRKSADGRFIVYDLESTNGTFVDGAAIHESALRDGALLTLGEVRFRFLAGEGGRAPSRGRPPGSTVQSSKGVIAFVAVVLGLISLWVIMIVLRVAEPSAPANAKPLPTVAVTGTKTLPRVEDHEPKPEGLNDRIIESAINEYIRSNCKEWSVLLTGADLRTESEREKPSQLELRLDQELKRLVGEGALSEMPYTNPNLPKEILGKKYVPRSGVGNVGECFFEYWRVNPYHRPVGTGTAKKVTRTGTEGVVLVEVLWPDGHTSTEEKTISGWIEARLFGLSPELNRIESKLADSGRGFADIVFTVAYRPNEKARDWIKRLGDEPAIADKFKSFVMNPFHMRLQRFDDGWRAMDVQMLKIE